MNGPSAYLDYAATTPMRPQAVDAMQAFLATTFGNPSGGHAVARAAKTALEQAREVVAEGLGARPREVVFTAGGSEADNLAVKGAARAARAEGRGDGVVTVGFEHKAVLASCDRLERDGFRVTKVPAGRDGIVELDALGAVLDGGTVVVSVMLVNNEVGTIQPLDEVAGLVADRAPRAVLHTDAVQAVPWLDVAARTQPAPLVSISAHKFGGPKGTGALVVRGDVPLEPLVEGGGQEFGLRAGTSNVAGAVAMAAALEACAADREADSARIAGLRDRLLDGLLAVPGASENGDRAHKIAGNAHVSFEGVEAEALLVLLDSAGVYAAAGSSCSSGATEPSHVLESMGILRDRALSSIRLSLGHDSTDADVDIVLTVVPEAVAKLRAAHT